MVQLEPSFRVRVIEMSANSSQTLTPSGQDF